MNDTLRADPTTVPVSIHTSMGDSDLVGWSKEHRGEINDTLEGAGVVLIRGFDLKSPNDFEKFMVVICGEVFTRSHPENSRSRIGGNVFTSTDTGTSVSIYPHSEACFKECWPLNIAFACIQPATSGGETPICDSAAVYDAVDPGIREKLDRSGVMYVTNWDPRLGRSWQAAFETDDPIVVEKRCRESGVTMEWLSHDRLRTVIISPAFVKHPALGKTLWFNEALTLHATSLSDSRRVDWMLKNLGEDGLPSQTYYGDGSTIDRDVLEHLRDIHRRLQVKFAWKAGDILLLDNMRKMHAREPYTGRRVVYAAMANPVWRDRLPTQ